MDPGQKRASDYLDIRSIITKHKYKEKNTSQWDLIQPKQIVLLNAYN